MDLYDDTNKTKSKEIAQCLYQGVWFPVRTHAREKCQQVGPVVPVTIPGQGLLLGLLDSLEEMTIFHCKLFMEIPVHFYISLIILKGTGPSLLHCMLEQYRFIILSCGLLHEF